MSPTRGTPKKWSPESNNVKGFEWRCCPILYGHDIVAIVRYSSVAALLCVSGQLGWEMVKLCLLTNSLFPGDTVHNWQFKRHFENCSASFVSTFASSLQSSNIRQRAKRIFSKRNWEFRMQQQTCPVEELLKKVCSKYFLFLSTVEYVVIQTRLGWPWQGQVQPSVECSGQLYTGQLWREEGTIMLGMDRQAG